MALFLLTKDNGKELHNGVNKMLVSAEDVTEARKIALGYSDSYPDGYWAGATISSALVAKPDYEGCVMRIRIYDGATLVEDVSSAAGAASDDVDDLAAKMVTALNATDSIANASYSTPNLTVASGSGGDDLGDHRIVATLIPASGEGGDYDGTAENRSTTSIFDAITDQGLATDALAIALDVAIQAPKIHAVFGDIEN